MTFGNFIDELRRRRVFRVAGVYLIGAWIAIQVTATVAPELELPDWTTRAVIMLTAIGFPIALLLAWAFDVRRDTGIAAPMPGPARRNGGIAYFGLGIVVALVGYGLSSRYFLPDTPSAAAAARDQSIVVLPFQNMSADQEQEFFSDGITEEILNALAKVPGLRVPARTTSFSFKGKNMPVREIAKSLGVAHVLEGSVRRAGDQVRITAQLIDARTDEHLWSETYDGDLKNIFALQEQIARAIAEELSVRVGARRSPRLAVDPRAYDLYLQGLHEFARRGAATDTAVHRFRKAIELDPKFARAYAALAEALAVLPAYSAAMTRKAVIAEVGKVAARALALDSSLSGAHAAMGYVAVHYDNKVDEGVRSFEKALAADSNYATTHFWYGGVLANHVSKAEEGLASLRRAAVLDPRSMIVRYNLADLLNDMGRYDEAMAETRSAFALNPAFTALRLLYASLLARRGKPDSAAVILDGASAVERPSRFALVRAQLGDRTPLERLLTLPDLDNGDLVHAALAYAILGDRDRALACIGRIKKREGGLRGPHAVMLRHSPDFDAMRSDPRFQALLRP